MSVFRRRKVFRDNTETRLFGGSTIVTATCAAAVAFATTVTGSTPALTGTVAADVTVSFGPISEATIEASVPYAVVITTTATGLQLTPVAVNAPVTFGVVAQTNVNVNAAVTWASSATVGTTFTMDVSAPIVASVVAAPQTGGLVTAPAVVSFSTGIPDISDGTVETATTCAVAWSAFGTSSFGTTNNVPDEFYFDTRFKAERSTDYTSSTAVVLGISVATPAVVSNGLISVNGGAFTDEQVMVQNEDEIRLQQTSSASFATAKVASVEIGGVPGTFVTVTDVEPANDVRRKNRYNAPSSRRKLV